MTILSLLLLLAVLFGGSDARATTITNTFTTAGSFIWTAPGGVYRINIEAWGGGGGGGSDTAAAATGGGGGGGGAYAGVSSYSVTPGTNYSLTVGAGGIAGTIGGAAATAGGNSSFNTVACVAAGGSPGANGDAGTGGLGGQANVSTGDVGYVFSGGSGAAGTATTGGGGGGSAGAGGVGGDGGNPAAGSAGLGGGAAGGTGSGGDSAGNPGSSPGGGGGGAQRSASTSHEGGVGAAGQVRITFVAPTVETFSTAGSAMWTAPAGVSTISIEAWGGGGGGGTDSSAALGGAGGGGGGAYAMVQSYAVTPGNRYAYTVGAGGGASSAGGASSFNNATCVAAGGLAGADGDNGVGGTGGLATASTGDISYDGGSGGVGLSGGYGGGGGGSGGTAGAGKTAGSSTGAGSVPGGGPGGDGGHNANGNSPASSTPGGGGGGGGASNSTVRTGGRGNDGQIRISYNVVNTPPESAGHNLVTVVDTPLSIQASTLADLDFDADGDPLTIIAVSTTSTNGPANNVTFVGGTITYSPAAGFVGADQFTYTISDGRGGTATCTNHVTVRSGGPRTSSFTSIVTTNGSVYLRGYGIPGKGYDIQYSSVADFSSDVHTLSSDMIALANGLILGTDPNPGSQRFYRLAVH